MIADWCGDRIIVAGNPRAAAAGGPYDLIPWRFGVSEAPTTTFESLVFFRQGGVKLYGLILVS